MKALPGYKIAAVGLYLMIAAGLPGVVAAGAEEVPAMTKEQHQEMAVSYENEAKELEAKIAQHERTAKVYDSLHATYDKHHVGRKGAATHCRNLVKSYRRAVEEARELAKHHHMMAEEAAK